jgi:hypothetical protein
MVAVVPAVIDHDILAQALLERENGDGDDPDMEMRYDDEERNFNMSAAQLAEAASKAEVLSLSYRNLCQLDNLQGFSSLVKLCLDNNAIEKMENLGHLQQLRWLDLSFNKIQRIEGLDTLLQLEDLSLFNNEVSTIEGLNACRKLQCLSLGNNKIATLDNIFGLRDFPRLEMVNLTGNPMCNESEYKYTVLAFLPSIKYHDYSLVDATEVEQAKEQYQDELIDLQEKEALEEERLARERTALKEEGELKAANLLIAKTLSADIFAADTEMVKLRYLPRIDQLVDQLNSQIGTSADVFVSAGLSKARHKMEQQRLFETARDSLRDDHARKSISLIEAYSRQKKRVLKEMGLQDAGNTADLSELQDELDRLETLLMDQEIYQVEQQIELINEYETACSEIRNQCYELQQTFFRACEAHEEEYFNAVGMVRLLSHVRNES